MFKDVEGFDEVQRNFHVKFVRKGCMGTPKHSPQFSETLPSSPLPTQGLKVKYFGLAQRLPSV